MYGGSGWLGVRLLVNTLLLMTFQKITKEHQVFYTERDYDYLLAQYRRNEEHIWSQEDLLIIAKGHFQNEQYDSCLRVINRINPLHSTKILFQRQTLKFKAFYLNCRKQIPDQSTFQTLRQILQEVNKQRSGIKGEPFKEQHFTTIQKYMDFVDYLKKHLEAKITYNQKLHDEQLDEDKHCHKRSGFPCYFISTLWLNDFNRTIREMSTTSYIHPVTNFAIVNDIFETYTFPDPLDKHRDTYIFPAVSNRKLISKKLWFYFCGLFAGDHQFGPVKRLYNEKQFYYQSGETVELIPAVVSCKGETTVYQLISNELASNQILPILEQKYGTGELRLPENEEASFQIFYSSQKTQKQMGQFRKILIYEQLQVPARLKKYDFFQHLDYRPLHPNVLSRKQNGLRGLQNLGNSCYMNSCLQCISFTEELTQKLVARDISLDILNKNDNREGIITFALSDLMKRLWRSGDEKCVSPFKFKKYFSDKHTMFEGKTQQDAHQFLLQLLNSLHEDVKLSTLKVNRNNSKLDVTTNVDKVKEYFNRHEIEENKSLIMESFRGNLHTTILCNHCKTASHSFDVFLALGLPIPFVTYQTLDIYFVKTRGRFTYKYEICLRGVSNINDIFKIFQVEVLNTKPQVSKLNGKSQKSEPSPPLPPPPKTMKYILLTFDKDDDPEQIWNYGFKNKQTGKAYTIDELTAIKKDLILYQIQDPVDQDEKLVLIEYKYNPMIGGQRTLGIPRFIYVKESQLLRQTDSFTKMIIQNDCENKIFESDIKQVKSYELNNKLGSFFYSFTVYFKRQERLFLESGNVDRQLNTNADKYSLKDCFQQMGKPQIIQDGWKCGNCHSINGAEKKEAITDTGNILIISLKRFQMNGNKIKNMIEYPVRDLDITEWLERDSSTSAFGRHIYDLYGVCLHQGTMEYGHYRAYCRHFVSGQWYEFDDQKVRKIEPEEIVSPYAYMLFYKLRQI